MTPTATTNEPLSLPQARVVRGIAIGFVATAVTLAALLVLVNQPAWWRGYVAATVVSAIAAAASIVPLVWGLRRGLNLAVAGYFMAAGARAIVSLGGCMLAITAGRYPAAPTLLLMVAYYFVLLGIESGLVARATWSARG